MIGSKRLQGLGRVEGEGRDQGTAASVWSIIRANDFEMRIYVASLNDRSYLEDYLHIETSEEKSKYNLFYTTFP